MKRQFITLQILLILFVVPVIAQQVDDSLLTVDSLLTFRSKSIGPVRWERNGSGYLALEPSASDRELMDLVRYDAQTGTKTVLVGAEKLKADGASAPLSIEEFELSNDGLKLLVFTNSARVWRSNTRGDYWVVDLKSWKLQKLGGTDA